MYMYLHKYVFTQVSIIISFNVAVCTCKSKIGSPPHHGAGAVGDAREGHHGQHVALILGQWSDIAEEEDYKMHKNKDIWMKLNSFEISIRRVLIQKEWGKEYHLKECIKTDVKTLPAKTFPFFLIRQLMFHDLHEIYFYISKLLTHLIGLVGFSCEPSAFPLGGSVIRKMIAKTARAPIIGVTRNPHLEDTVIWTIGQTKEWIKIKIKAINLLTLDCKMDLLYKKEGRITILD